MKKIGIIGGLGAFATSRLYDLVNQEAVSYAIKHNGGDINAIEDSDFPELIIHQVPFASSDRFGSVDEKVFRDELQDSLLNLKQIGITDVAFACNTQDRVFSEVVATVGSLNYVSTVAEVGMRILTNDTPLVIMTSKEARSAGLYRNGLISRPTLEVDQDLIDRMIHCSMVGRPENAVEAFQEIVSALPSDSGILLGCTELSIYDNTQSTHKTYDSLQFLAEKIVRIHHENP